jgi:hypothetical protein
MKIDPLSATWLNIQAHLDTRAAEIRAKLEGDGPLKQVRPLRAALKEIKAILALAVPEEPALVEQDFELPS